LKKGSRCFDRIVKKGSQAEIELRVLLLKSRQILADRRVRPVYGEDREAGEKGAGFDAVLLHLTIPAEWDGAEILAKLREADPQVKAILCTRRSGDAFSVGAGESGFCGVLHKPFCYGDLADLLKRTIGFP
jgi:DNA-binding response OmpR family regulator